MQGVLPVRNGHLAPPLAATVVTVRERVLTPLAQLLEHSLQEDHLEVTQSTGQALVLQERFWLAAPQALPPWAAARVVARYLDWEPLPQVLEQAVQLPQADCTQSTGQE